MTKSLIEVLNDALRNVPRPQEFLQCDFGVLNEIDYGNALLSKGDLDEAEFRFYKALKRTPKHSYAAGVTHLFLGHCYLKKDKKTEATEEFELAEDLLEKAIELDPNNSFKNHLLGLCYCGQGNFRDAENALMKSIEIDPNNSAAYGLLGDCYYMEERFEEARSTYQKALLCIEEAKHLLDNIEKCEGKIAEKS